MKRDRLLTITAWIFALIGIFALIAAKFILGGILMGIGVAMIWMRGSGKFNERSLYEKVVKSEGASIAQIYHEIKDMDTPLGKPWIADHVGYVGDSIVFGPNEYKDMVVISFDQKRKEFSIKHINKVGNIRCDRGDEWHFDNLINEADIEVTPLNYSLFAARKVICAIMLMHLTDMVQMVVEGQTGFAPKELDMFRTHYYNSKEGYFCDEDGARSMTCEEKFDPFTAKVFDLDGNELARIEPRAFDKQGYPADKAGYDMYADGEMYADIERTTSLKKDTFICRAEGHEFQVSNFMAVDRANISQNYTITCDGKLVAVVGGNRQLEFEGLGMSEHDVILSFDDDYLVFYAEFAIFLMTVNQFIRK